MVFDYRDYKKYLDQAFSPIGAGRGSRSRLAKALNCQTAFISHVLNGHAHFSYEHAVVISQFLDHTSDESRYFMLLVGLGRAGSKLLEDHYNAQIEEVQRKRIQIKERITTDRALTPEIQMRYYSAWYYSAIHVATSVPEYQTRDAIAVALGLAPALVSDCLEFLLSCGLVAAKGDRFIIGPVRMHLGSDSSMLSKLHTNWRLQALQSIERPFALASTDLHYSTVLTLSHADAQRVREILLRTIDKTEALFRPSPEEVVYCVGIDWFRVSR